jgi:D-amino-acid dehydrogenase
MTVVVVGGGLVGLSTAYQLSRRGVDVTVVDAGTVGGATSRGNGGWITPSLTGPIARPGVMRQALRWMLSPSSPFYIRPRPDPALARWCWGFWRSSSSARYEAGLAAAVELGRDTLGDFDELRRQGVSFESAETGLLFVGLTHEGVDEYVADLRSVAELGYDAKVEVLDGDAARRLEPALSDEVVAAAHATAERWVRPESLSAGLAASIRARGGTILERTQVRDLVRERSVWRVVAADADLLCDQVLVSAGVWSSGLLRTLGTRVPLEGAKGYSVTTRGTGLAPRRALYFTESKVGSTPFEGETRLSGTLELSGLDLSLNRRRLRAIENGATRYLRDWRPSDPKQEWAGLRPYVPDTMPVLGAVPGAEGAFVATGHGMSGVTLAPATGKAMARFMVERTMPPELAPFAIDGRF